jgi:AAA+ ATPase superfamily predicted ATPase
MRTNPFNFRNAIRDPARFCGRQAEIRQIADRVLFSAHEGTAIVGDSRIGKTSLLYHLSNPQVAAELGIAREQYCVIYLNLKGLTDMTPRSFLRHILRRMAEEISDQSLLDLIQAARNEMLLDLSHLEDLLEAINDKSLTVVLLMDDFEYVTENPNFKPGFFRGLMALAIHNQLALVTATRFELVESCLSEEMRSSPFFDIFASVVLRPFTARETDEFIDHYTEESEMPIAPEERALISEIGGGHPFFLQIAGCHLVERKAQGLSGEELRTQVMADCDRQLHPHCSSSWIQCSESEKIALLAILALSRQKPSQRSLPNLENLGQLHSEANVDAPQLLRRGLIMEVEGRFCLLSPCMERWLGREISATPGKEESLASVEDWLAAGGRQDLESVKGFLPHFKKHYWKLVGMLLKEISSKATGAEFTELLIPG